LSLPKAKLEDLWVVPNKMNHIQLIELIGSAIDSLDLYIFQAANK
tara:strand:+ start:560 stop:694 length:135 start_codon:yes stop_codon:yes gene_type:complete